MSTEEQKTKKREGPSIDERCDPPKKRATDVSEYEKDVNQETTEPLNSHAKNDTPSRGTYYSKTRGSRTQCHNCGTILGKLAGRCTACLRATRCTCSGDKEGDERCQFCNNFGPESTVTYACAAMLNECSKISLENLDYAKENLCLSHWTGRCKGCGNRCCCKCLVNETLLCLFCAETKGECSNCFDIVDKSTLKEDPECRQSYSKVLAKWINCQSCQKCANYIRKDCFCSYRKHNSDVESTKTRTKDLYCSICQEFKDYRGPYCSMCEEYGCFKCIGEGEDICNLCNKYPF